METFLLKILDDKKILFNGQARECRVTTPTGSMGFEAHHEEFAALLTGNSDIEYTGGSGTEGSLSIRRGVLLFVDNECTITVAADIE